MLSYVIETQLRAVSIRSCATLLQHVIWTAARVSPLPAQDSDIWIIAWMMYRTQAKATDVRGHEVSSLSARDKLRLLSFQGEVQSSGLCSHQIYTAVAMFCMLCHHRSSSSDAQMSVILLQGANSATMRTPARSSGMPAQTSLLCAHVGAHTACNIAMSCAQPGRSCQLLLT
jgi:hypothetical protein